MGIKLPTMPDLEHRPDNWNLADEGYIRVTRLDYNGNPYDVWQRKPGRTKSDLWAANRPLMFQSRGGMQVSIDKLNDYFERENNIQ